MSDLALRRAAAISAPAPVATRVDGATRAWRIATTPFWLWSDGPAPDLPGREADVPGDLGLAGEVFLRGLDGIRARLWLRAMFRGIFRGAWLALLLASCWMAWSLIARGPALDLRLTGIAMAAGAALGLAVGALSKPSRARTAAMLDRTWGLQERMATAAEGLGKNVPAEGERAAVPYLQMANAANTIEVVRRDPLLAAPASAPVRDIALTVSMGLLLASLALLRGTGADGPPLADGVVPPFVTAAEMPVEPQPGDQADARTDAGAALTAEEALARAQASNAARQDLQALASALADHAVTRRAAEAIGRGDYERAADELRRLAPDAPDLSETARQDLAGDLDRAASSMSEGSNELESAAQDAAGGLREGEKAAQEGMRSLAEAVESAGAQVAAPSELADQMREARERDPEGADALQRKMQEQAAQPPALNPSGGGEQSGEPSGQKSDRGAGARDGSGDGDKAGEPGSSQQGQGDGEQQQPGQAGSGESGQGASADRPQGDQSGSGKGEQDGDAQRSGQGGGAGSGESAGDREKATRRPGTGAAGNDDAPKDGAAPGQRVTEGDGGRGQPNPSASAGNDTISLPSGRGGEQGVQTTADGGSALPGSGSGVTAGSGTATQGEVGESGPDSNHVPAEYRDIVQDYFSLPEQR